METIRSARPGTLTKLWSNVRRNVAAQDGIATTFHALLLARVLAAPDGVDASTARATSFGLLVVTAVTVVAVRGELLPAGRGRALFYRIGLFLPMALSYFQLRALLAALQPASLDPQLLAIDEAVLGTTPAIWLSQLDSPWFVEWFSFFYYSYFFILAAMLIPALLAARGRRLAELMLGSLAVVVVGHLGYTLVPALGPWATMSFEAPLDGRFFWGLVLHAVESGGARWDVFPSLHTAFPTFLALHAWSHRMRGWPVLAWFATHIVLATMALRWHYAIDIVAGLGLAWGAHRFAVWVAARECERGDRQPVWEPLSSTRGR